MSRPGSTEYPRTSGESGGPVEERVAAVSTFVGSSLVRMARTGASRETPVYPGYNMRSPWIQYAAHAGTQERGGERASSPADRRTPLNGCREFFGEPGEPLEQPARKATWQPAQLGAATRRLLRAEPEQPTMGTLELHPQGYTAAVRSRNW